MKIKLLFVASFIIICFALSAQSTFKFGHINSEEIFTAMPELQEVKKVLDEEYGKHEGNLTTMQEELKKGQEAYIAEAKNMTPEQRATKEKELIEMNQRIQNFYQLAQQQLQEKEQELKAPLIQKLQNAIQQVGNENGFLYIFDSNSGLPVYHSEKSVDVAPLVKAKLGIK
ncbi:MAG: OmpH family outer membrane protein [Marinilabiliaceae bacterium]|nr:OmpH family outer membrane protein [Marinilabiliaceae bacterium]